ncbi:MAG: HPr(Ser) kinase/phosphatase [Tissierellales bacterium]|nr:HPr(Ser) kinase/phosphatase [Tissierellales bacterium]
MDHVALLDIINELNLKVIHASRDIEKITIRSTEISRPGLQMTGYYEKFVPERVQIIGSAEWQYLSDLGDKKRYEVLDKFLSYKIPVLIISRDLPVFEELIKLSVKHDRNLVVGTKATSSIINDLVNLISLKLAPMTTVHGVMMEVYGIGVLITGKSGVGKSETALDLITRGSRLIADDLVEIKRVDDTLRGSCPEIIRYFLEIRGVGIIDIERIYGIGAVKQFDYIDLVVHLEAWDDEKEYDRVGLEEEKIEILGIEVPRVVIPVKTGRNIAMIVEVAAKNNRQKRLGYNAAETLNERVKRKIEERKFYYVKE